MRLQCMDNIIECAIYGDSYRGCNAWRIIWRVKYMVNKVYVKIYGYSYRRYNVGKIT